MSVSPNRSARLRRFSRNEAGVTAVEFGLIAPIFFGFVFMIAQVGLYFYNSASLSYATNAAARQIMTGAVANAASMSADRFRSTVLCPLLPGSMSCNNIITHVITVPSNGTFYGLPAPAMDNTRTSFCIGQPGSYVVLQVYYAMPVLGISAMLPNATNYNGVPSIFLNANNVFANEPFTTSYTSPPGC